MLLVSMVVFAVILTVVVLFMATSSSTEEEGAPVAHQPQENLPPAYMEKDAA